jgi:site-specific DNA recombinase
MRAAIYARYSSDLQREISIEDQLATARRYASQQGWTVADQHLYTDSAVSGASIQGRAGVQRLLSAAAQQPRPFDVVLVDDSSRISRDIADAIRVMQTLKFLGVRVIYLSQGIDSASEQADALVAVHGLIDSLYLKELAKEVQRGLIGQYERGFATGSRTYGFRRALAACSRHSSGRADGGSAKGWPRQRKGWQVPFTPSLFRVCQVPYLRRSHDQRVRRQGQSEVWLSPVVE